MSLADLFVHPERWPWLFAALGLGALGAWLVERGAQRRRHAFGRRWESGAAGLRRRRSDRRAVILVTIGACAVAIGLADPRWGQAEAAESLDADVVICLDVSRSMLARDVAPSRLGWARAALLELASATRGERLALVAFAGDARLVVPLTEDMETFAQMASEVGPLSVERGGTDLAAALNVAGRAALGADATSPATLVLISDGEGHGDEASARALVEELAARGIVLHTIAVGSSRGAKIPTATASGETFIRDDRGLDVVTRPDIAGLARLAEVNGGEALHVDASSGLVALIDVARTSPTRAVGELSVDPARRRPRSAWFFGMACLAWLAALRWRTR